MKFSGKMCIKIMLKVTKNQGFIFSLEDTFFEKPRGGGRQIDPPVVLGLSLYNMISKIRKVVESCLDLQIFEE